MLALQRALGAAALLACRAHGLLTGGGGKLSYQPSAGDRFGSNFVNIVTSDAAGTAYYLPSDNQAGGFLNAVAPGALRIGIRKEISASPPDYKTMYRLPISSPVPDQLPNTTFDLAFSPGRALNGFLLFQWWQGVGSPRMCQYTCPPISVNVETGANGTAFRLVVGNINQYQGAASTYRGPWVLTQTWHTFRLAVAFSPVNAAGKIYAWFDGQQFLQLDNVVTGFPGNYHGRNNAVLNAFGVYLNKQNVLVDTYVDFANVSYYPTFLNAPF